MGEGNGAIGFSDAFDPPEADEWVHIAVTLDEEGEVTHYLNGEENGIGFIDREAIFLTDEDTSLFIGSRADGTTNMHGMLDDVAIFNEALTAEQVVTIMNGDFSPFGGGGVVLTGDFNDDGNIDGLDIDLLSAAVLAPGNDLAFDLTGDGNVDNADRVNWIVDVKNTYAGDSNLDGEFNSTDFVLVFSRGEYEDEVNGNSGWSDGDWNGDGDFNSSDFVTAFSDAGYEQGPRPAAVPEPATVTLAILGCLVGASLYRRRK
ncbi:LamG-like jellyroll fold domain-containing protein [Planctomycetota bacterium]